MKLETDRRSFLRGAVTTSALLVATRARTVTASFDAARSLMPVKVSRDRVIREVVGLRPYRPEGFRVEAERVANQLLIHNYGHGGAGITLSWGTASLALGLAAIHWDRGRPARNPVRNAQARVTTPSSAVA